MSFQHHLILNLSIFLLQEIKKLWKIPSGELLNLPYLEKISRLPIEGKEIVLSTGMATIEEIKASVNVLTKNWNGS